ncbi:MAG TPA: MerR family transcriptional regulator, partial [Bacteroidetes bacterium]|nr:MerR family transcriptional regulator [Bacteroidota bacterium]
MNVSTIKKLYYSIGEVSKITSLKKYVLRYWETEFDALRPGKNRAGNRIYKKEDIQTIFLIKKLLYEEKYTLEGAKKKLAELRRDKDFQLKLSFEELKKDDVILEVKR